MGTTGLFISGSYFVWQSYSLNRTKVSLPVVATAAPSSVPTENDYVELPHHKSVISLPVDSIEAKSELKSMIPRHLRKPWKLLHQANEVDSHYTFTRPLHVICCLFFVIIVGRLWAAPLCRQGLGQTREIPQRWWNPTACPKFQHENGHRIGAGPECRLEVLPQTAATTPMGKRQLGAEFVPATTEVYAERVCAQLHPIFHHDCAGKLRSWWVWLVFIFGRGSFIYEGCIFQGLTTTWSTILTLVWSFNETRTTSIPYPGENTLPRPLSFIVCRLCSVIRR